MPKIWSPVILAQLDPPRTLTCERVYPLDRDYQSIEDLRVKVHSCEASSHGKYVESLIRVNILALLQPPDHEPELGRFADLFKEWLPISCFEPPTPLKLDTGMIVEVDKITCEGDLEGRALKVRLHIDYTILAVQNEAIDLSQSVDLEPPPYDPEPYYPGQVILDTIRKLEYELQRLSQDNAALNHRIMLHEKNLASLKNALRKAESRSQELFSELLQSRRSRQALQEQLEKNEALARLKKSAATRQGAAPLPEPTRSYIGDKIRQLFALG